MTGSQVFSGQVAAYTGIILSLLILLYTLRERYKKNNRVVIDASSHNLKENTVVYYIPKKKYLLERKTGLSQKPHAEQLLSLTSGWPENQTIEKVGEANNVKDYQYPPRIG